MRQIHLSQCAQSLVSYFSSRQPLFFNSCLEASIWFAIVLVKLPLHAVNCRVANLHVVNTELILMPYPYFACTVYFFFRIQWTSHDDLTENQMLFPFLYSPWWWWKNNNGPLRFEEKTACVECCLAWNWTEIMK